MRVQAVWPEQQRLGGAGEESRQRGKQRRGAGRQKVGGYKNETEGLTFLGGMLVHASW